jgi:RNA binding exosome subunit
MITFAVIELEKNEDKKEAPRALYIKLSKQKINLGHKSITNTLLKDIHKHLLISSTL